MVDYHNRISNDWLDRHLVEQLKLLVSFNRIKNRYFQVFLLLLQVKTSSYAEIHTSKGWFVDFYQAKLGSLQLLANGTSVTEVLMDGEYVAIGPSPGLEGRNT